jgi:MFS family permease
VLLAGFVALLDVTIVNVALAQVQWDLGARYEAIQWFIAGYALPFGFDHWGQTR